LAGGLLDNKNALVTLSDALVQGGRKVLVLDGSEEAEAMKCWIEEQYGEHWMVQTVKADVVIVPPGVQVISPFPKSDKQIVMERLRTWGYV